MSIIKIHQETIAGKIIEYVERNEFNGNEGQFLFVRYLLLYISLFFAPQTNFAQTEEDTIPAKSKINTYISGGFGYLNDEEVYIHTTQDQTIDKFKDKGCFYLKGELRPDRKRFGIGLTFFYSSISYKESSYSYYNNLSVLNTKKVNLTNIGIGLMYNYYFINKSDIQAYVGFGGGIKIPTADEGTPIYVETIVGVRLFLANHFSLYAEVGVAKTIVQIGGAFTF